MTQDSLRSLDCSEAIRLSYEHMMTYQAIDLSPDQVFPADELRFNRDPFDALIVAGAQMSGLPLISRGAEILESGAVKTIW